MFIKSIGDRVKLQLHDICVKQCFETMKEITIRTAVSDDLSQVYGLIKELAVFENEVNEPSVSFQKFTKDFKSLYDCLVAVKKEKVVGISLYYWGYSTWKGKLLYLDDLVVSSEYRKMGIGSALFNRTVQLAKEEGAGQMRWQVLDWNDVAIDMYKKADADFYKNWLTCKLEKQHLINYRPI